MALACSSYLQLLSLVINPQEIVCVLVMIVCIIKFFEWFESILNLRSDVLIKSIWVYKTFFFTCEYVQWKSLKFNLPRLAWKTLQKHTHTPARLAQALASYLSTLLVVSACQRQLSSSLDCATQLLQQSESNCVENFAPTKPSFRSVF